MGEKRQLEFFLLRYVPDAVREEFVNIGVVALEDDGGFADVRFTRDWRRVRCLDPEADIEMLEAMEREIRVKLGVAQDREGLIKRFKESFSNLVQLSPTKGCLAENPALEMETLASLYLEARRAGKRAPSGREVILRVMREAFEEAGVLRLMHQAVDVAPYTWPNDPLKIDFAYRVGGVLKMFHATPIGSSRDTALGLAFRYPKIKDAMQKVDRTDALLTAVIEDAAMREERETAFALQVLEESRITVAPVSEMSQIAEVARRELRA